MTKLIKTAKDGTETVLHSKHKPFSSQDGLLCIEFTERWDKRRISHKVLIGANELYSLIAEAVRVQNNAIYPGCQILKIVKVKEND